MALLNKTQAAKAINVSRQTLYQYIRQSRISANADGMIDTAELLRAGFELRQPDMLEVTLSGQGLTVDDTPQVAHVVFLAGVYLDRSEAGLEPRFVKAEPPSDADISDVLQKISHRVIRKLRHL